MSEREPISNERLERIIAAHPSRDWWHFDFSEGQSIALELIAARKEIKRLTIIIQSVRTCDDGGCLMCAVCSAAMCALVVEDK